VRVGLPLVYGWLLFSWHGLVGSRDGRGVAPDRSYWVFKVALSISMGIEQRKGPDLILKDGTGAA